MTLRPTPPNRSSRWPRLAAAAATVVVAALAAGSGASPPGPATAASSITPWVRLAPSGGPDARYTHGMVYDSRRDRVVLFGGDNEGLARLGDTWEHDGAGWVRVEPPASPPGRVNVNEAMVYDPLRGVTVLYGGLGDGAYLDDTWEYDGRTWRRVDGDSPPARDAHAAAFDARRGVVVLFGGFGSPPRDDTWIYDGAWTRLDPPTSPPGRSQHSMAFDERRGVIVMHGGRDESGNLDDTWEFDGRTWNRAAPASLPWPRHNHRLVYDPSRGIVLFGGESLDGRLLTDDWVYDGTAWRPLDVPRGPAARKAMGLVADPVRERLLLFGGGNWIHAGSLQTFGDTWALPFAGRSSRAFMPVAIHGLQHLPPPKPVPEADLSRDVLVLSYDPLLRSGERLSERMRWHSHEAIAREAVAFFRETSGDTLELYIVDWTVVDEWPLKADGFRYDEDTYMAVMRGEIPGHAPDDVDYDAVVADPRFDICGRANRGEIDEVWMFGGPYFGYAESRLVGPGGYWYNSTPMEDTHGCERLVPIMGLNYERDTDQALHSFGHRAESAIWRAFRSWEQNRADHDWERFAMVAHLAPDFAYSGCGNIHFPPNATSDYDYGNTAPVDSICADFADYPRLDPPGTARRPVTCEAWGCSHLGYLRYWFGHLPASPGCTDGRLNDWWRYIFEPERANAPAEGCP